MKWPPTNLGIFSRLMGVDVSFTHCLDKVSKERTDRGSRRSIGPGVVSGGPGDK